MRPAAPIPGDRVESIGRSKLDGRPEGVADGEAEEGSDATVGKGHAGSQDSTMCGLASESTWGAR